MKKILAITVGLLAMGAVSVPTHAQQDAPNGYYNNQPQNYRSALSADDQQKFDKEYAKWVDSQRKDDRDDIAESARHMQDIMSRNNIPTNVSFDQLASNPAYPAYQGSAYPPNGAYPNAAYPAYPNGGAPVNVQVRLTPDDQREFDEHYAKWVNAQKKNDSDDIGKNADKMRAIMSRAGIPANVPFGAIATNGYLAGPTAPAYGNYTAVAPQRLSSHDQSEFDKHYKHWVDARHKRDIDDIDKNAREMQEIMARYNIPANVPFERIASPGVEYH
jgi:hypothetical protein